MLARRIITRTLAVRRFATAPPPNEGPPLLLTLREDLKTAMRERDQPRSDVIKLLLSDITKHNKTKMPIQTDVDILRVINRRRKKTQQVVSDAKRVKRLDFVETELSGLKVLDAYAEKVEVVGQDAIMEVAERVVKSMMDGNWGEIPGMGQATKFVKLELQEKGMPALKEDISIVVKAVLNKKRSGVHQIGETGESS